MNAADLFDSIRKDDLPAIEAAAADLKMREARGPGGATPLIYAAALGSPESVRALIEAGADVKARTDLEANALVWAGGDPVKTAMLVEAGADVNAASKSGQTPLLVAAARDGNAATVELLLDRGADLRARGERGMTALLAACFAGDEKTVKLLLERGADPNQADMGGNTPMQFAAATGDRDMMRPLLEAGARVNDANTFFGVVRHGEIALKGLTPLMLAAPYGSAGDVRLLLEAGAEVNARDSRGVTPLMFAVVSSKQDQRVVKALLAHGADAKAVSNDGETALDWAARFGDREMMALLEQAGAERKAQEPPAPVPAGVDRDAREAVLRALDAIQRADASSFRESACVSCHHQNMSQVATAAARKAGVGYDEEAEATSIDTTLALWTAFAPGLIERMDAPGTPDTPTFSLFALALQGREASFATDALFANIAAQQRKDGSWRLDGFARPPMEESNIARTAMAAYALSAYSPAGRRKETEERLARARSWIAMQKPRTTDDYLWRLAGLKWTGARPKRIERAKRELAELQRPDGGWAPTRNLASDAYSTGSALWALHEAGAVDVNDAVYQRGLRYLLATQQEDGTWFQRNRTINFQPYFESGFPYGHDQWISAAATAWAAAAMAPAAGVEVVTD